MRIQSLLIIVCSLFIAGSAMSRRPADGNGNKQGNVIGDTTEAKGPIESFDKENKMFILGSTFGKDTIYYTDATQFSKDKENLLKQDLEVNVRYIEIAGRKTAISVSGAKDTNGGADAGSSQSNGAKPDTNEIEGSITAFDERSGLIVLDQTLGEDSIYVDKNTTFTGQDRTNLLRQKSSIRVKYFEVGGRKVAIHIKSAEN